MPRGSRNTAALRASYCKISHQSLFQKPSQSFTVIFGRHHFTIRHIAFGKATAEHSQQKRAVRINISVVDHVESLLNAKMRQ